MPSKTAKTRTAGQQEAPRERAATKSVRPEPVEGRAARSTNSARPAPVKGRAATKPKAPKSKAPKLITDEAYKPLLRNLQIELVKLQRDFIRDGERILVILEGRDAAGKDGTIKRITQHLSPRDTRVVALSKPSDREQSTWYFQRYVEHLPAASKLVLFNRSWYNRAGVERVMGFCTDQQYEEFMGSVIEFEHMLVRSGIRLLKYYLDISKDEQQQRLNDRLTDPLAQWKVSPIDAEAQKYWDEYSQARDEMLSRTHDLVAPWTIVRADHKKTARVQLIQNLLSRLDYEGKDTDLVEPDTNFIFDFAPEYIEDGRLAP